MINTINMGNTIWGFDERYNGLQIYDPMKNEFLFSKDLSIIDVKILIYYFSNIKDIMESKNAK